MATFFKVTFGMFIAGWLVVKIVDLTFTIGTGTDFPSIVYLWLGIVSISTGLVASYQFKK